VPTADAHLHLFADGFSGVSGASPAGGDETAVYERLRRCHGIERSLVLGYEGEPRYLGNSDYVLSLARTRPWMAPMAYLPITPPPTPATLREFRNRGAIGFALYPASPSEGQAFSDWPSAVFVEIRRQSAVVSVNADPDTAAQMARMGADLDGCAVLVSHLGSPSRCSRPPSLAAAREQLEPILALAAWSNVNVKFSGLYAISDPDHDFPHDAAKPFVDVVIDAFGPSRLLWGSDFPPALDFVSFAQLADARLLSGSNQAEVDAVMGGNLLRLLDAQA
jgi:L-fuconolactonase